MKRAYHDILFKDGTLHRGPVIVETDNEGHFLSWHPLTEEEPFTDEQLYWMRQPAKLHLTKGKNHVELHVPKTYKGLRWSFAFIPICTQLDGSVSEVEGLKFGE